MESIPVSVPKASPDALPELAEYLAPYLSVFQRRESRESIERYVTGLLTDLPRKNCDTIAQAVTGTSTERLQHLPCDADWDAASLEEARIRRLATTSPRGGILVATECDSVPHSTDSGAKLPRGENVSDEENEPREDNAGGVSRTEAVHHQGDLAALAEMPGDFRRTGDRVGSLTVQGVLTRHIRRLALPECLVRRPQAMSRARTVHIPLTLPRTARESGGRAGRSCGRSSKTIARGIDIGASGRIPAALNQHPPTHQRLLTVYRATH